MTLYILAEAEKLSEPIDISVFLTLKEVALAIEPVDVENGEYFLFDSDGIFYEIVGLGCFDQYEFRKIDRSYEKACKAVENYYRRAGLQYEKGSKLRNNVSRLLV